MKNILVFFLCSILAVFAIDNADECELNNIKLLKGEKYLPPNECQEITCHGDNLLGFRTCGAGLPSDSSCIYIPENKSKPFPDCCPTYKCE